MSAIGTDAKDARLMAGLLTGMSITSAAAASGYSVRTVFRRLHDQEFRSLLASSATAIRSAAEAQLVGSTSDAVEALRAVMCGDGPPAPRVAAARAILELATAPTDLFPGGTLPFDEVRNLPIARYMAAHPEAVGPIVTRLAELKKAAGDRAGDGHGDDIG